MWGTGIFWHQIRRDFGYPEVGSWWPMILLVPLPIFTYILQVNRIVNTWTLLAIIATYLAYLSAVKAKHWQIFSILGGGAIYLGFIAKGPVAFFPFAVPLLAWIDIQNEILQDAGCNGIIPDHLYGNSAGDFLRLPGQY